MKIVRTTQPAGGPAGKPKIANPVIATLAVPVFYMTERGPIPSIRGILCAKVFADTVLRELEAWATEHSFGIVHLGCYNARYARKKNGKPIKPIRWSAHSYAAAIDLKGVITQHGTGQFVSIKDLKRGAPAKYRQLLLNVEIAIRQVERRPEIIFEGGWLHCGIWAG